jgi:hypothetical protein
MSLKQESSPTIYYKENQQKVHQGFIYQLLTDRPDNRRPLTWERNHADCYTASTHS